MKIKIVDKAKKFFLKKKKRDEKKAKLLDEFKQNDLQMKHINSNVNKIDK